MIDPPLHAVVWDFDNTLIDTRARNRSVTRRILTHVTGRDPDEFEPLRSQRAYDLATHRTQNWQDLYRIHFGLDPETTRAAGRLWTEFQRDDPTPAGWFEGVREVIHALRGVPQAIVSMNTRDNIRKALEAADLVTAFSLVVGCEEVAYNRQKPRPDGLLHALETLTGLSDGQAVYVGDHPVDAACVAAANRRLSARGAALRVISVAAAYGSEAGHDPWEVEPDFRVDAPVELHGLLRRALARAGGV